MASGTQPYMAAFWLNQYHPRNKTRPWFAMASRGNKNSPRIVLQSTATKIVIKLMNCNQYRVGTRLHRVHTDCLGRKFSPQRSQYTVALPQGFKPAIAASLQRLPFQKLLARWAVLVSVVFLAQKFICPRGADLCVPLVCEPSICASRAHRNQEAGAPALRPSSCSSSNCFCRFALRFSKSFNWPFLSLM